MTKEEKILSNAFEAGFSRGEFVNSDSGHSCPNKEEWVSKNVDDVREYAKRVAVSFGDFIRKECQVDIYDELIEYEGQKYDSDELYTEWQQIKQQQP